MCFYKGIVEKNNDPEKRGRLRLRVPTLLGSEVTDWAWPCVPPGWPQFTEAGVGDHGNHTHTSALPKPGDAVWVTFEDGDESLPVWVGTWAVSGTVTP